LGAAKIQGTSLADVESPELRNTQPPKDCVLAKKSCVVVIVCTEGWPDLAGGYQQIVVGCSNDFTIGAVQKHD